ncbi:hypothetical protein CH63R_09618 [Colletotrichum higginsianum IMI 349063]|uniref:Uncharacterized protein n=1 Tax=Colletotrichum higginsianum (strain IMI 349063) TaxID=759273 RepID=A0A1B7Y7X2_COLHI|nr:hypothetical protein CH63R_09618 [Colletotrichum higginsianum IMI 349063]OBR08097.1 hypothetical protein CH63R_09618 [Colletotrichum higginsianum IMI 349063]
MVDINHFNGRGTHSQQLSLAAPAVYYGHSIFTMATKTPGVTEELVSRLHAEVEWLGPNWDSDESPLSLKQKKKGKAKSYPPSPVEPEAEEAGQGELNGHKRLWAPRANHLCTHSSASPLPKPTAVSPKPTPGQTNARHAAFEVATKAPADQCPAPNQPASSI